MAGSSPSSFSLIAAALYRAALTSAVVACQRLLLSLLPLLPSSRPRTSALTQHLLGPAYRCLLHVYRLRSEPTLPFTPGDAGARVGDDGRPPREAAGAAVAMPKPLAVGAAPRTLGDAGDLAAAVRPSRLPLLLATESPSMPSPSLLPAAAGAPPMPCCLRKASPSRCMRFSISCKKFCCGPMTLPGRQSRSHEMISVVVHEKCFIR